MAQYWTPYGLTLLAPSENSAGDPTLCNSTGHCGLYQFARTTWQEFAPAAGVNLYDYPTANLAPAEVQTAVALVTPISNWTCPGCNSYAVTLAQMAGTTAASPQTDPLSLSIPGTDTTSPGSLYLPGGNYGGGSDSGTFGGTPDYSGAYNPSTVPADPGKPYCGNPGVTWWQRLTGQCTPNSQNPAGTGPFAAAAAGVGGVSGFLSSLSDPNTWTRVGVIAIGAVILLAALFLFGFASFARSEHAAA